MNSLHFRKYCAAVVVHAKEQTHVLMDVLLGVILDTPPEERVALLEEMLKGLPKRPMGEEDLAIAPQLPANPVAREDVGVALRRRAEEHFAWVNTQIAVNPTLGALAQAVLERLTGLSRRHEQVAFLWLMLVDAHIIPYEQLEPIPDIPTGEAFAQLESDPAVARSILRIHNIMGHPGVAARGMAERWARILQVVESHQNHSERAFLIMFAALIFHESASASLETLLGDLGPEAPTHGEIEIPGGGLDLSGRMPRPRGR